jgi:hypothetical protein
LCFAHHGPGYLRLSENEKVASGVVLHVDSYDLHATRFFDKNELESLFYSWSFVVSFSIFGRVFSMAVLGRSGFDGTGHVKLSVFVDGSSRRKRSNCGHLWKREETDITRERNNKRSRIKQRFQLIFIKESNTMQIVRIYVQEDARRNFLHFLTTEDIPVHDERNIQILTSSRFTQACWSDRSEQYVVGPIAASAIRSMGEILNEIQSP